MASIKEFRGLLESGDLKSAFTTYELDFNKEFDGGGGGGGYEADIEWVFQAPNIIKMIKSTKGGKKIYYLPWAPKKVTTVTLDGNSPPYFVTSHFSNCRFTMKYHDTKGTKVTVMHVAGDSKHASTVKGSKERDVMDDKEKDPDFPLVRRMSIAGAKAFGAAGRKYMKEQIAEGGTTYYDTYARLFGVRGDSGKWEFYAQDINHKGVLIGILNV